MFSIKERIMSGLVFPLYHFIKRDGVLKAIRDLESNQWKTSDELRSLQKVKLNALLKHCEKHVPYYRKVFSQRKINSADMVDYNVFKLIPLLTKEIVNKHRDDLIADNVDKSQLISNSTGGSTGESMCFYNDKLSTVQRQAVVCRNQAWVSALYSDKEVKLWGAQMDLNKLKGFRSKLHGMLNNTVCLSSYDLSDSSMAEYVKIFNEFKPKLLTSYASPLAVFSQYIIENNIKIHPVKSIITSAEKLYDWQRVLIDQAFKSEIFDRYGCREFGNIAHECSVHEGYHVNDERFFIEILDEDGNPVEEGEIGKIYITDLDNYGFPFVRYEIGDLATTANRQCSCGRGLSLIERLEGRSFDIIKCPNGNRVAGTFWTICLRRYAGVVRFQVIQTVLHQLKIKLVVDNAYSFKNESGMKDEIYEKCGQIEVSFDYVDTIELSKSGKEKLVISQVGGA